MKICNDNHEEIAFEHRTCPLCELEGLHEGKIYLITELEKELEHVKKDREDREETIRTLREEIETLSTESNDAGESQHG